VIAGQTLPKTQTVTILKQDDAPASRFQVVIYGSGETPPHPLFTCATQGEVTCWLICNGYKWIQDTQTPQRWTR